MWPTLDRPRQVLTQVVAGGLVAIACCVVLLVVATGGHASSPTVTYSATRTIPVPPASTYAGSGGGDGWAVALSATAVYNVFHHAGTLQVACHEQADASPCWNPRTITDENGDDFATSGQPGLWLNQSTGQLYVYATRYSDATAGVVCIDTTIAATETDPYCGYTQLTAPGEADTSTGISSVSDGVMVGSRFFAYNYVAGDGSDGTKNTLLCFDTQATAPCTGQPFFVNLGAGEVSPVTSGAYPPPAISAIGTRLIIPISTDSDKLACFDAASSTSCTAHWPVEAPVGYPGSHGAPFPLLTASGKITGLCLPTGDDPCWDLDGGVVQSPSGLAAAVGATSGWNGPAFVLGPRVYVPDGNANQVDCFDYKSSAGCANFPHALANLELLYTVNPDPQRPSCIWVNADGGDDQIQNFDAYTGGACGEGPIRVLASSIVAPSDTCVPATYSSLRVDSPPRSSYSTGMISFEDGDGDPLGQTPDASLDGDGAVDLSHLNLNSATGLPQFLITLDGSQGTPGAVQVTLTWTGTYDPACVSTGTTVTGGPTSTTGSTTTTTPTTPTVPAPRSSGTVGAPDKAVVFVGGLDSTQGFSDPSSFARGCTDGTWGKSAAAIRAQVGFEYQVFDAPMDDGKKATPDCPHLAHSDPPDITRLDTHDYADQDVDGTRLLVLLSWIHKNYGVDHFWLVGHSYGGIWSRSALTQLAAGRHPQFEIDGLYTVGTPHTGSFGADLYKVADENCLRAAFSEAPRIACGVAVGVHQFFGSAIDGLTHASLAAWNGHQTQQASWGCVPVVAAAGNNYRIPVISDLGPAQYVTPNDVIVGELSATGRGPGSSLTQLINEPSSPMIHIPLPFHVDHNALVETDDPLVNQEIVSTVLNPPRHLASCPGRVAHARAGALAIGSHSVSGAGGRAVASTAARAGSTRLVLHGVTTLSRRAVKHLAPGTPVISTAGGVLRCGRRTVASEPLLGLARYVVTSAPACPGKLALSHSARHAQLIALTGPHVVATVRALGHGRLRVVVRGPAGAPVRVRLTVGRRARLTRALTNRPILLRGRSGRHQIQIVVRTVAGTLGTTGTVRVR